MQIHLKHPQHGVKMVLMELEAEHDEKHGWKRYNPVVAEPAPPEPEVTEPQDEPVNELAQPAERARRRRAA